MGFKHQKLLFSIIICAHLKIIKNIAKSEPSSHTPGGSHHRRLRPYHFNFLEKKKISTNKGTDKQNVADSFINSRNCHK